MSSANIESLQRAYDGFGRRDVAAVLEAVSDNIEWDASDALAHTGVYRGHDGVRDYIQQLSTVWDEFELEPDQFIEAEDGQHVMVLGWARGRLKGTSESLERRFAHIGQLKDGKVLKLKICMDRASAQQILDKIVSTSA
jgi:ketosteroid isomerase-like protein